LSKLQVAAEEHKLKILSIDAHKEGGKGMKQHPSGKFSKNLLIKIGGPPGNFS
jgi:hypothetical protein